MTGNIDTYLIMKELERTVDDADDIDEQETDVILH